ncbi:MAG: MFS transporter [Candidatus Eremiobacteraeota bacterium]|nr:MFS transporter [Candidatus Eremiobacteraeota bacterium]
MTPARWLTATVVAIAVASLLSDACYELIIPLLPALIASLGGGALALGAIEGVADGLAAVFKLWGGALADRSTHRRLLAASGYLGVGIFMPAIGLATSVLGVGVLRACAWVCRGFRSPIRDTLLVDDTDPRYVNRAFGFQRALDSVGAVIGPVVAIVLVAVHVPVAHAILFGLIPGLAAAAMYFWVRERPRVAPPREPIHLALVGLPSTFKRYLAAAGIFGLGNFSPTLLVLVAMHSFAPSLGLGRATAVATALYLLHNMLNASFAYPASLLSERMGSGRLLLVAFTMFAAVGALIAVAWQSPAAVVAAVMLAGIGIAIVDPMEGTFATHLLPPDRRGTGFGVLAAVNGVGDLVSSLGVGALWQMVGPAVAFGTSAVLCIAGVLVLTPLVMRISRLPTTPTG